MEVISMDSLLVLFHTRGSIPFQTSPRRIFSRLRPKQAKPQPSFYTSNTLQTFPLRAEQKHKQDEYLETIKEWKGSHHVTSKHVTHFIATTDNDTTVESAIWSVLPLVKDLKSNSIDEYDDEQHDETSTTALDIDIIHIRQGICEQERIGLSQGLEPQFRHDPSSFPIDRSLLPVELLAMGSIWFLPHTAPRDSSLGVRPNRLQVQDLNRTLIKGDYLRIHHNPRRFPTVSCYDWGKSIDRSELSPGGTIVAQDDTIGYIVVQKPGAVPVHASVDNLLENVCAALGRAMIQGQQTPTYISAAQRLDQDTSGLFVVCTKPEFAAYFSKLLRNKTDSHLGMNSNTKEKKNHLAGEHILDGIHKRYRCLVCLLDSNVQDRLDSLARVVYNGEILRHYMEESVRAPKVFVPIPPTVSNSTWLECLLRITRIGPYFLNHNFHPNLIQSLWGSVDKVPDKCIGVLELEIELLTGRSHQIRGQLALEGMPICGDTLYGGSKATNRSSIPGFTSSGNLALQCCELEFYNPVYIETSQGRKSSSRSNRLNRFRLDKAWWSRVFE